MLMEFGQIDISLNWPKIGGDHLQSGCLCFVTGQGYVDADICVHVKGRVFFVLWCTEAWLLQIGSTWYRVLNMDFIN